MSGTPFLPSHKARAFAQPFGGLARRQGVRGSTPGEETVEAAIDTVSIQDYRMAQEIRDGSRAAWKVLYDEMGERIFRDWEASGAVKPSISDTDAGIPGERPT